MTVSSIRLLFDNGDASPTWAPGKDPNAVSAAIDNMIAERAGRFSHRVQLRMADGATVIARAKPQTSFDQGCLA